MTSLGAIQSAAEPSSGALAGMVAAEVTTVSSPPVSPLHVLLGGVGVGGEI